MKGLGFKFAVSRLGLIHFDKEGSSTQPDLNTASDDEKSRSRMKSSTSKY